MSFIISIVSFVVALGILITVHEFGHFWVARKCGVKVLRFSVGFGKPLLTFRRKNDPTEYVIAGIPLGGYVKMLDENEGSVAEEEKPKAFNRQPLFKRMAIVLAGPALNLIFAVLAFWVILVVGEQGIRSIISEPEKNSIAAHAGFEAGDEIIKVDGRLSPIWRVAAGMISTSLIDKGSVNLDVIAVNGSAKSLTLIQQDKSIEPEHVFDSIGLRPLSLPLKAVINKVVANEPAELAGIKTGDLIISTNGVAIESWQQWVEITRASAEKILSIELERDAQIHNLQLIPKKVVEGENEYGRIGASVLIPEDFASDYYTNYQLGLLPALTEAITQTGQYSWLTLKMIGRMVIGEASVNNLSGPISLAKYAGQTATFGLIPFLKFLAFVSVSLGVLNLLPIPMLDGGHFMFYVIEGIRGKAVSIATQEKAMKLGMMILFSVMLLAVFVDISRYVG